MDCAFIKTASGNVVPYNDETRSVIARMKTGQVLHGEFRKMRNYQFHQKFFAMLGIAYEFWSDRPDVQTVEYRGQRVLPNKKQFREDITILAGFYETSVRLDGSVRVTAKSISFANMEQDEFEALYSAVVQVVLDRVLVHYKGRAELDNHVAQVLEFDR